MNTHDSKWGIPRELIAWIWPLVVLGIFTALIMPNFTRLFSKSKHRENKPTIIEETNRPAENP